MDKDSNSIKGQKGRETKKRRKKRREMCEMVVYRTTRKNPSVRPIYTYRVD
jgi:hypothetical protein